MSNKEKSVLSRQEVLEVICEDLNTFNFQLYDYVFENASETPTGFLGDHVILNVKVGIKDREKRRSYFVKTVPFAIGAHREYIEKTGCFFKEIGVYKTIFQDFKNARNGQIQKWHPQYFYSRNEELFVVEDLCSSNYYMYPERTLLDEQHVVATLNSLAAFHACSIVLEEKLNRGEMETSFGEFERKSCKEFTLNEVYPALLFESYVTDVKGHPGNTAHESAIRAETALIRLLPGYTSKEKEIITKRLPDKMRRYFQLIKSSDKFKNVIVHGDLWSNNILFRKDKYGKVENAVLIDFQLTRFAPPAQDVMMFLHLVQNEKFRKEKRLKLLQHYYSVFSAELESEGFEASDILPWDEFLESCDYYDELGLLGALFFFQLILTPSDIASKLLASPELFYKNVLNDRTELLTSSFLTDKVFAERMTQSIDEYIKKFVLI